MTTFLDHQIEDLSQAELDQVDGGIAPFLIAYAGAGFALGVTSAIAAYAATRRR